MRVHAVPDCGSWGIVVRSGYQAGIQNCDDVPNAPAAEIRSQSGTTVASKRVAIDTNWHTLRVQVRGNSLALSMDGTVLASGTDESFASAGQAGVWADRAQVDVRSFTVQPARASGAGSGGAPPPSGRQTCSQPASAKLLSAHPSTTAGESKATFTKADEVWITYAVQVTGCQGIPATLNVDANWTGISLFTTWSGHACSPLTLPPGDSNQRIRVSFGQIAEAPDGNYDVHLSLTATGGNSSAQTSFNLTEAPPDARGAPGGASSTCTPGQATQPAGTSPPTPTPSGQEGSATPRNGNIPSVPGTPGAGDGCPATRNPPVLGRDPGWSGYVVSPCRASSPSSIVGHWHVPAATKTSDDSAVEVWVGFDGYPSSNSENLLQVGTESRYDHGTGQFRYIFWWEEFGPNVADQSSHDFAGTVLYPEGDGHPAQRGVYMKDLEPGDEVTASVRQIDHGANRGKWAISVSNDTRHWSLQPRPVDYAGRAETAEWIVEDPCRIFEAGVCWQRQQLTDFGQVTFTGSALNGGSSEFGRTLPPPASRNASALRRGECPICHTFGAQSSRRRVHCRLRFRRSSSARERQRD